LSIPPPQAQGQSFSVALNSPLTATGVQPADILGIGGGPLIACQNMSPLCRFTGAQDELQGLSYGYDFVAYEELPALQFSVGPGSTGQAGTAVNVEAMCPVPEPFADVFESPLGHVNHQDLDGDGQSCGGNGGFGLGLTENDDVDALERDPCKFVDLNCDGDAEKPILFTLAPNSPSLAYFGASSADILISGIGYGTLVWASAAELGLDAAGDAIDALCIWENGSGVFDEGDRVLFSLTANSATVLNSAFGPADLIRPGPRTGLPANALGLDDDDELDAVLCSFTYTFTDIYLPFITK
jgi:hypothetical protein